MVDIPGITRFQYPKIKTEVEYNPRNRTPNRETVEAERGKTQGA